MKPTSQGLVITALAGIPGQFPSFTFSLRAEEGWRKEREHNRAPPSMEFPLVLPMVLFRGAWIWSQGFLLCQMTCLQSPVISSYKRIFLFLSWGKPSQVFFLTWVPGTVAATTSRALSLSGYTIHSTQLLLFFHTRFPESHIRNSTKSLPKYLLNTTQVQVQLWNNLHSSSRF